MKFLLEWVSCYGVGSRSSDSSSSEIKDHPPYAAEDTGLLMIRPRKRGRLGSRSGTPSSEWKPSLRAISEEGVGVMDRGGGGGGGERKAGRERGAAAAAEATVVVNKKKTSRDRVHDRGYKDDYARASIQTVIPAFSPTPFVF